MEVSRLTIYPIKSCRGIELDSMMLEKAGPRYDRNWMLVDEKGKFITQREHPSLARVKTEITENSLKVGWGEESIDISLVTSGFSVVRTRVWKHEGPAYDCGDMISEFFSDHLGMKVSLVALNENHGRMANAKKSPLNTPIRFADGYPLLVIGEESLEDLNQRASQVFEHERFRANIWTRGAKPYQEDLFEELSIGEAKLVFSKKCTRCQMTTVDPAKGVFAGNEPLKTLSTYRKEQGALVFGANYSVVRAGEIRCGHPLNSLTRL